ncbi:MAG: hypothetical protein GMKNLPBB_00827 [Myxococcota bacterium]|nr:hypothetical protein [Myxococcota bacterium]
MNPVLNQQYLMERLAELVHSEDERIRLAALKEALRICEEQAGAGSAERFLSEPAAWIAIREYLREQYGVSLPPPDGDSP